MAIKNKNNETSESKISETQKENTRALYRVFDAIENTNDEIRLVHDEVRELDKNVSLIGREVVNLSDSMDKKMEIQKLTIEKDIGFKINLAKEHYEAELKNEIKAHEKINHKSAPPMPRHSKHPNGVGFIKITLPLKLGAGFIGAGGGGVLIWYLIQNYLGL